jgi:SpoIID/LytB domain protein
MSQEGAKWYGANGWSYSKIITHYYPGVAILNESPSDIPSRIIHDGVSYELKEYLARIAYREIGRCGLVADEAIRAQIVCAYTIAKRNGFKMTNNNQCLLSNADWYSSYAAQFRPKMLELAASVLGKYVAYNGKVAQTLYSSSCVGRTASAQYVWNSAAPEAYLTGGRESPETVSVSNPSFTTDQLREMVRVYNIKNPGNAITLSGDASQWIKIVSTDQNGYVQLVQIGNRTFMGNAARLNFFGASVLRSHNFTFAFSAG